MATVIIHPRYGESFSPKQLNMLVLKRFMDFHHVSVSFMKRRLNGDILLKTTTYPEPDFLGEKHINGVSVMITLPDSMNYHKGIIHHPELQYLELDDLWELLKPQVAKIVFRSGDTFAFVYFKKSLSPELPATLKLGWDQVKVKPCQPRPLRCYKCQQYGHIAEDCRNSPVCAYCAGEHATSDECGQPTKCAACGGEHTTFDDNCKKWKEEKAIQDIKHQEKISYKAALLKKKEQDDKKKKEDQEEKKREEQQEQEDEEEEEEQEEDQELPPQDTSVKRKHEQEDQTTDESSSEEEEMQAAPPQVKSGATPDTPGGWRKATSRRKRK